MPVYKDQHVIESWKRIASAWTQIIQSQQIESRAIATNQAIIDAVLSKQPKTLLDIGCGEGWLSRALTQQGIDCLGIDAIAELIQHASQQEGRYQIISYEALDQFNFNEQFDVLVCNFSLLGKQSVENVFANAKRLLSPSGWLIVQTIHPATIQSIANNQDSWQIETWDILDNNSPQAIPWYARSMDSWETLFKQAGFKQLEISNIKHPNSQALLSVIFSGSIYDKLETD
ncbi:MAG: methyltransferase domain-containing protein [Gammaproteobacteria bacterium]|nr:methyltransferase domain-containing protein [Gammaproteobacteria bacterium]MDH5729396.1 methyltransferase domain-containing protein [Gammaproteobacteria bacterium]